MSKLLRKATVNCGRATNALVNNKFETVQMVKPPGKFAVFPPKAVRIDTAVQCG